MILTTVITCEKCGSSFYRADCQMEQVEEKDLTVTFFRCPDCKKPYLVLASNAEMRELIDRRKAIREKLMAAHSKKFGEDSFKKYIREDLRIKKKQMAILPDLQKRGKKVLERDEFA